MFGEFREILFEFGNLHCSSKFLWICLSIGERKFRNMVYYLGSSFFLLVLDIVDFTTK